jgi:hypothetical protein
MKSTYNDTILQPVNQCLNESELLVKHGKGKGEKA